MTQELTAAEKYRQKRKESPDIVDVTLPSGDVFQFRKPSVLAMLFHYGKLPTSASDSAVGAWIEQGVLKEGEFTQDQAAVIDESLKLRDRVLELSFSPKLVIGEATGPDELSTDDVDDDDLTYLLRWVKAGGDESVMLSMFPAGRSANTLASARRPKRRKAAK